MRPIERIDNFLNLVNWRMLYEKWKIERYSPGSFEDFNNYFLEYWKKNHDQRIGQVLINLGIIPDSMEAWCTEEFEILIGQGIAPEECLYWTSIYDENGNKMNEPKTRLVADLEKKHIRNILNDFEEAGIKLGFNYITAFNNMLNKKTSNKK